MAIRRNSYATDPALKSAFDNLAEAFKTPSGSDVYGYVHAGTEAAKGRRLAELFNYSKAPDYNQTQADRMGVAAGLYNPNQSYYSVDLSNATTRRNQDAVNANNLTIAREKNAADLQQLYAKPVLVNENQTAFLPKQTAEATGMPEMFRGNIALKQGEQVVLPSGERLSGQGKPLTDSEVKGAIIQTLPRDRQIAAAMGSTPVTNIDTPEGPTISYTADAIGKRPVFDPRNAQVANYKTPDGRAGTAALDPQTRRWRDTQTGEDLPSGSQTYTANLQGDSKSTGLGASTQNNIDTSLLEIDQVRDTAHKLRNILQKNPGVVGLVGDTRATVQNLIQTGNEVGQLLNVNLEKLRKDAIDNKMDPEVRARFENFDPNIPAAQMLQTMLIAQVAKIMDPNGRISNERYQKIERAFDANGYLSNTQGLISAISTLDGLLDERERSLVPYASAELIKRRGARPAPANTGGGAEVWERGPDGTLQRKAQ